MDKDRELTSESASEPEEPETRSETAQSGEGLEDAIGAYLLDALPEDERVAFEAYLRSSPESQEELRQLAPVVALLPALFEQEPVEQLDAAPASPELRERIITAAEANPAGESTELDDDLPAEPAVTKTIRTTPEATGPFGQKRAAGRIRSGAAPAAGTSPIPFPVSRNLPMGWLAAGLLGIVAIGAIFWALALQGRIDSKNREITAQAAQIADLRQNANATSFTLASESETAPDANGTLLYSLRDQIGVLYVQNLPGLEEGRVYQLWYLDDESAAPVPGGTFRVNTAGSGIVTVNPDTPSYDGIAITEEPQGGSEAPTSGIIMSGQLGGAAG